MGRVARRARRARAPQHQTMVADMKPGIFELTSQEKAEAIAYVVELFDGNFDAIEAAIKAHNVRSFKADKKRRDLITKNVAEYRAQHPEHFDEDADEADEADED